MNNYYSPETYWEDRLTRNFNLTGVGYAGLGPIYNQYLYQARYDSFLKILDSIVSPLSGKRVAEIGPGTGFFTEVCKQFGVMNYLGIDLTEISVNNLKVRYPDFQFIKADIGETELIIDPKFDFIIASDVLYHIIDDNKFLNAICNIANLLRPNGYLIVSDVFCCKTNRTGEHVCLRSYQDYMDALGNNGLRIVQLEPIFVLLHPPSKKISQSLGWGFYSFLWQLVLRRLSPKQLFSKVIPRTLYQLDKNVFLKHSGINTPNNKWLVAVNNNVE